MRQPKTRIVTSEVYTWIYDWLEKSRRKGTTKTFNVNKALEEYICRKDAVSKSV